MRERLALMRQLHDSLSRSRQAVLDLNLAGLERETQEQVRLSRTLKAEIRGGGATDTAPDAEDLAEELRRSQKEVAQAARVQLALLTRVRRKAAVMANMLTGPATNYPPSPVPEWKVSEAS